MLSLFAVSGFLFHNIQLEKKVRSGPAGRLTFVKHGDDVGSFKVLNASVSTFCHCFQMIQFIEILFADTHFLFQQKDEATPP